jgi:hypothetical protein
VLLLEVLYFDLLGCEAGVYTDVMMFLIAGVNIQVEGLFINLLGRDNELFFMNKENKVTSFIFVSLRVMGKYVSLSLPGQPFC